MRQVLATRYVTPLREGGSLPAIVEADDLGTYVAKFRGAGQGPLALVAEIVGGEIARLLGLHVPETVLITIDPALGRNEADDEIRDLLNASVGLNVAADFLPGAAMFDPATCAGPASGRAGAPGVDAHLASAGAWLDAFITNVDRMPRNPNLLCWGRDLYFIDHGAALYFHHNWNDLARRARDPFPQVKDHVLLPWASALDEADARLRPLITEPALAAILAQVPDDWLLPEPGAETPALKRRAYVDYFLQRADASSIFVEEAKRARSLLV